MHARTPFPRLTVALALAFALTPLAPAARADTSAPARAARITYLEGSVAVADSNSSLAAQLNQPLISGVHIATGPDGQAELEFEDGSIVRITPNSVLSLDNLAVTPSGVFTTDLSLLNGLAYVELRAAPQYRYTLNAGGDILSPVENTTVRVNFDQPPAIFAVLDGTAQIQRQDQSGAGYQATARAGESLQTDPSNPTRYFLTEEIAGDSWDQWNEDRDQEAAAEAGASTAVRNNYAGSQGYGWSDLDADGSWYDVPGQGPVWQPQEAIADDGFDPYGNGAWVWYPATGYVWASGYSWGWTPYRCGSWSYFGGFGWGWAPGSACGGLGWGFAGGGFPVNIAVFPRGYQPIRVPVPAPGSGPGRRPQRPLIAVHITPAAPRPPGTSFGQPGPRHIAGVTVNPIERVGSAGMSTTHPVGSSLRRDFPIDALTHTPVLGLPSARTAPIRTTVGGTTVIRPANPNPSYGEPSRPGAVARPAPVAPVAPSAPVARPTPSTTPAPAYQPQRPTEQPQRSAPQPVQRQAPQPQVQRSAPPPPPRPMYTPHPPPPPPRPAPAPASRPR